MNGDEVKQGVSAKNRYLQPEAEIIPFDYTDIIRTSEKPCDRDGCTGPYGAVNDFLSIFN